MPAARKAKPKARRKPARGDVRAELARRIVRAGYDAARTTDRNRRHWEFADLLSADAGLSPEVRRILRSRSRHENDNNPYFAGCVETLGYDCIGRGPRLQMLTDDEVANDLIEDAFAAWADAVDLAGKLRTMRESQATDGEAFAVLITNPKVRHPVMLDLRLVEADQVTDPNPSLKRGESDGIEFDEFGNPEWYSILNEHPGSTLQLSLGEATRYPASQVLHVFKRKRASQTRGKPELTASIETFAKLHRYTNAVIGAAEIAALFAGILYTDAPANGEATRIEPLDIIELEQQMLTTMPAGWKMAQVEAQQPTTTYREFKSEHLNEAVRPVHMPRNVAAGDSSAYNYASGRLDHKQYFKATDIDRERFERHALDRILMAFVGEWVYAEPRAPRALRDAMHVPHQWFWPAEEHVDPNKEATAAQVRVDSGLSTYAEEYAKQGKDWKKAFVQRAKEEALKRQLSLAFGGAATEPRPDEGEEARRAA